ncbi:MAG: CSLREA domain-containing protein, partial [Chloroflexi bacterium]|nr:CSLREA domain-containing protein [Chloroflexota bacterium]
MYMYISFSSAQSKRGSVLISLVITAVILLLLFSSFTNEPLQAAGPYTVNTTSDTVDANPGDGACADAGGLCSLRAAIQEANAFPGDDLITLSPAAIYALTINGDSEDGSATGDLDINSADAITITGAGQSATTIDAAALGDRVFHLVQGNVTISGVYIVNGDVTGNGGGILVDSSATLTLSDVALDSNVASGNGGGIYATGPLILDNVLMESNGGGAVTGNGASIYTQGSAMQISNSAIGNSFANFNGGVIFNDGSITTIQNSRISG